MTALALLLAVAQGTFFQQLFPQPTGKNGYEEYVMAADLLDNDVFQSLRSEAPSDKPDGRNMLTIATEAVAKFGKACEFIRQGNLKPVFDPRSSIDMNTTFPELGVMKNAGVLLMYEAYTSFAKGNSAAGLSSALDGLTYGRRIQTATVIQFLVGYAVQNLQFRELDQRLDQLSLADGMKLENYCRGALKERSAIGKAFATEQSGAEKIVDALLGGNASDYIPNDELETKIHLAKIAKLSPAEKELLKAKISKTIKSANAAAQNSFDGPEGTWSAPKPRLGDDLADFVIEQTVPVYDQIIRVGIRERVAYRLALLHARVIQYRWKNNKLPEKLSDAADAKDIADPASGSEFVYEHDRDHYALISKGTTLTGPILLRERPKLGDPGTPPPGHLTW